jgi:hypothetical protein
MGILTLAHGKDVRLHAIVLVLSVEVNWNSLD